MDKVGKVISVSRSRKHNFSKEVCDSIRLLQGLGVEGDAHCGKTVKHRSRVAVDPKQPNLRQVHLIHSELLEELKEKGYTISPGEMGENILTEGIDVLTLPRDTLLHIGDSAIVKITGLRNPCKQIDDFRKGLLSAVLSKDKEGNIIRKSGIMGIVMSEGIVSIGDKIKVELPPEPNKQLESV